MVQVKRISCRKCDWFKLVNGEPMSKIEAKSHRDSTKHRDYIYAQITAVRV